MRYLVLLCLTACVSIPKVASPQADDQIERGGQALAAGDLDRAEADYALALRYAPHAAAAMNGLGLVCMARHDRAGARGWFAAALREEEDFAEAHANLGALALEEHDLGLAVRESQAALAVDPGFAAARHNLARALAEQGQLARAREEYMLLTSTTPDDAAAWGELAGVELALEHGSAAARAADRALELEPDQAAALMVRGTCRFVARAYAAAASDFARAGKAHPLPHADFMRGECGRLLGDEAMMRDGFERFLRATRGDASLAQARAYAAQALD